MEGELIVGLSIRKTWTHILFVQPLIANNSKEIDIQWENPTLEYLLNNDLDTIQNKAGSNIYTLREANQVSIV
jgi:hypothetical protein